MIAIDKQAHFLAGYALSVSVGLLASPGEGLLVAIAAGVVKELVDAVRKSGTPDPLDFVATAGGGLLAYIFLLTYLEF